MTPDLVAVAVAAAAVLAAAVLAWRGVRVEHRLRTELRELSVAVARAQSESLAQVGAQLTGVLDRFHTALSQFGAQLRTEQDGAGASTRAALEHTRLALGQQLDGLVGSVNEQLARAQESMGQRFEGATRVFGEVRGQLGRVAEMAARMEALGREIEELQGILKAPKLRGLLGEAQLEELLAQVLPRSSWRLQHRFSDGQTVDAVIMLRDRLVPIDAKFPLEAFKRLVASDDAGRKGARRDFERSVKGRVDEIADRYIRPGEGTLEFALMLIPAESVYYEAMIRDEGDGRASLLDHALTRRVVPVSPGSFYAYLSTVATGLRGLQVEARAGEILAALGRLQREFEQFGESFRVLGRHVTAAHGRYEEAERLAGRFAGALDRVAGDEGGTGGAGRAARMDEEAE